MAKIKGAVVIDKERCKGCEVCVVTCPTETLALAIEVNSKGVSLQLSGQSRDMHWLLKLCSGMS